MYHVIKIQVKEQDEIFPYCEQVSHAVNNLYNASLFRCRQVMTAVFKDPGTWTDNEKEVMNEIEAMFRNPVLANKYTKPDAKHFILSYGFLNDLMRTTENPDFFSKDLSRQMAQQQLKSVSRDMKAFHMANKSYRKDPSAFTGKPKLPNYKKSGGMAQVTVTNQDCVIYQDEKECFFAKFPLTKATCRLGKTVPGRLKEVKITPTHGIFVFSFTFDDGKEAKPLSEKPNRICAIDLGVENIAAMTNNVGAKSLLFKGGVIKSKNQWYNKRMAKIRSDQTVGTTNKFVPTKESAALTLRRENVMNDFMHKVGKRIISFCVENTIDTIVIGVNKGWKQKIDLGRTNNQNFVQIPFLKLKNIISNLAAENGIRLVEQEESYTSKASFTDGDFIPVYGTPDAESAVFSGRRAPTSYKGMHKSGGFRGLYKTNDGSIVNSDLNGSANIGRKAFPELFRAKTVTTMNEVVVIKHPDEVVRRKNREKQMKASHSASKAKQKRLAKKATKQIA